MGTEGLALEAPSINANNKCRVVRDRKVQVTWLDKRCLLYYGSVRIRKHTNSPTSAIYPFLAHCTARVQSASASPTNIMISRTNTYRAQRENTLLWQGMLASIPSPPTLIHIPISDPHGIGCALDTYLSPHTIQMKLINVEKSR